MNLKISEKNDLYSSPSENLTTKANQGRFDRRSIEIKKDSNAVTIGNKTLQSMEKKEEKLLNPAQISKELEQEIIDEISKLEEMLDQLEIFPKNIEKSVDAQDERKAVTNSDYNKFEDLFKNLKEHKKIHVSQDGTIKTKNRMLVRMGSLFRSGKNQETKEYVKATFKTVLKDIKVKNYFYQAGDQSKDLMGLAHSFLKTKYGRNLAYADPEIRQLLKDIIKERQHIEITLDPNLGIRGAKSATKQEQLNNLLNGYGVNVSKAKSNWVFKGPLVHLYNAVTEKSTRKNVEKLKNVFQKIEIINDEISKKFDEAIKGIDKNNKAMLDQIEKELDHDYEALKPLIKQREKLENKLVDAAHKKSPKDMEVAVEKEIESYKKIELLKLAL